MSKTSILMITQDVEVTRRILQEAKSLQAAGYDVRILTRAAGSEDRVGEVQGIPVEWVAVQGRDPRFGWLYRLVGQTRGTQAVALFSVLTGRHTFTLRATPRAIAAKADIYHAHDLNNLQLAFTAARANKAKLVYDAHELFAAQANRWVHMKLRAWKRLEKKLMPQANLCVTVNDLIADELARRNKVKPPLVVLNCPDPPADFNPDAPHNMLRARLNIAAERPIVLYQGWMSEGRGLENLVDAAPLLARSAVVVFMGYGEYQAELERRAISAAGRIFFLPAVPQSELLTACASADIGIIPYQAVDLNNYYTSPNKLFDFIQSRTPIVASDLPFLRRVIKGNKIGVVAKLDSPASYAAAINEVLSLPDNGAAMRANASAIAPQYTWVAQGSKLVKAYQQMELGKQDTKA